VNDEFRDYDAAYVLGALPPDERRTFERHLAGCPDCADSVRVMAGMPGLLARVRVEDVLGPPEPAVQPSEELLPRLLTGVSRRRRTRRFLTGGAVGLAVAACLALLVVLITPTMAPAPPPYRNMTAIRQVPIRAAIQLSDKSWGTQIALRCKYTGKIQTPGGTYPEQVEYGLYAIDKQHQERELADWTIGPGAGYSMTVGTGVPRSNLESLVIRGPNDETVLSLSP
jgi:putative zinc finger protein